MDKRSVDILRFLYCIYALHHPGVPELSIWGFLCSNRGMTDGTDTDGYS